MIPGFSVSHRLALDDDASLPRAGVEYLVKMVPHVNPDFELKLPIEVALQRVTAPECESVSAFFVRHH